MSDLSATNGPPGPETQPTIPRRRRHPLPHPNTMARRVQDLRDLLDKLDDYGWAWNNRYHPGTGEQLNINTGSHSNPTEDSAVNKQWIRDELERFVKSVDEAERALGSAVGRLSSIFHRGKYEPLRQTKKLVTDAEVLEARSMARKRRKRGAKFGTESVPTDDEGRSFDNPSFRP